MVFQKCDDLAALGVEADPAQHIAIDQGLTPPVGEVPEDDLPDGSGLVVRDDLRFGVIQVELAGQDVFFEGDLDPFFLELGSGFLVLFQDAVNGGSEQKPDHVGNVAGDFSTVAAFQDRFADAFQKGSDAVFIGGDRVFVAFGQAYERGRKVQRVRDYH